jgi:hypothetical protein
MILSVVLVVAAQMQMAPHQEAYHVVRAAPKAYLTPIAAV